MNFNIKVSRGPTISERRIDAPDADAAARIVAAEGWHVISLSASAHGWSWFWRTRKRFSVLLFARELRSLLVAGITVVEAIDTLFEKEGNESHRAMLGDILWSLRGGSPLSSAIARYPSVFNSVLVAGIEASEHAGQLPQALARFIEYQTRIDRISTRIRTASVYPILLTVVGALVVVFLMFYVVPRFSRVFDEIGTELPLFSRVLLEFGKFVDQNALAVTALACAAIGVLVYAMLRGDVARRALAALLAIPYFASRIRVYLLGRFYRTIAMLLLAGVPLPTALRVSRNMVPPELGGALSASIRAIDNGLPLSEALRMASLTTPVADRLLGVAEKSGEMGAMMDKIADFHDEESAQDIETFISLFEPLVMAAIGLVVGGIVLLMYMPIFELASVVQ